MAKAAAQDLISNRSYTVFVRRILEAQGRRVDDLEDLAELLSIRSDLDGIVTEAVRKLRHEPLCYSWTEIAEALGITRQAAQQRWGHVGGDRIAGGQPTRLR
jgi:hypothetical protein